MVLVCSLSLFFVFFGRAHGSVFGFGQFLTQGCDGMCLTRFDHLDLKFPKLLLQYACCNFFCNMHIATCKGDVIWHRNDFS